MITAGKIYQFAKDNFREAETNNLSCDTEVLCVQTLIMYVIYFNIKLLKRTLLDICDLIFEKEDFST